uniref:Uncharacterized protein n=1 Tax=Cacopsylla melanoneura TaxID=428564 RepID=A0A8D8R9X0_9HEMI
MDRMYQFTQQNNVENWRDEVEKVKNKYKIEKTFLLKIPLVCFPNFFFSSLLTFCLFPLNFSSSSSPLFPSDRTKNVFFIRELLSSFRRYPFASVTVPLY